jgi:hypothetical protein
MIRERMKALALFIFLLYGESWYMYCDLVHVCYMYSTVKTVYMYNKYMSHMFKSLDFFIAAMNTYMYQIQYCIYLEMHFLNAYHGTNLIVVLLLIINTLWHTLEPGTTCYTDFGFPTCHVQIQYVLCMYNVYLPPKLLLYYHNPRD